MADLTTPEAIGAKSPDLQLVMADIATLKRDLAALLTTMSGIVASDVAGAKGLAVHLGDDMRQAYHDLAAQGERTVKAIGHQVEERPVVFLLLAFAAGFLGSRLLPR
ncbi:hypothetical protein [Magnetospirillum moscoviense]|uniref:DUF883 domain-containing protein n=1 Tax=Magnetospirillum moscoviense TaxID=1437059 RepID=A0A178MR49_9PROT|nr:hypothetical protein [Magnetospirillum moscoviense]OAN51539.1 hypothetical protein A6A05_01370 [Magnetospirillum moscoviense]